MKKLRRLGLQTEAAANAYLEATYTTTHNARFACAPAPPEDFHRRAPTLTQLDRIFRLETERTVDHHWVVRHDNQYFQTTRQSAYPPARSKVLACEAPDGTLEIWYRDRRIAYQQLAIPPRRASPPPRAPVRPHAPSRPSAAHPWRQAWSSQDLVDTFVLASASPEGQTDVHQAKRGARPAALTAAPVAAEALIASSPPAPTPGPSASSTGDIPNER